MIDPPSIETILQANQQEQNAEGNAAATHVDVEMALEKIASIHSASSAQVSARGTKRKRHQEVPSQRADRPDPTLLPTGIQLSIVGKEEFNVGLYSASSPFGLEQLQANGRRRLGLVKSAWHSDEVHRHCANDPDLAEFLHECWDPMAKLLCECLPEDPDMDLTEEYTRHRSSWQEEWGTKNHVMFQDMLSEGEGLLVRDVCARIESLGKS